MICVRPSTIEDDAGTTGTAPPSRRTPTAWVVPAAPFSSGNRNRKSPLTLVRVYGVAAGGTGAAPGHISTFRPATGCAEGLRTEPRTAVSPPGGRSATVGQSGVTIRKSPRAGGVDNGSG